MATRDVDRSRDLQAALLRTFPAAAALDALESFGLHGRLEDLDVLAAALERLVDAAGARGAILTVDTPVLRPVSVGVGTLREGFAGSPSNTDIAISSENGEPIGSVRVDGDRDDALALARALELALRAAVSVADARQSRERLSALDAATRVIAGELDIDRVLQLIVEGLRTLVGASYAALGITNAGGRIERFITSGISAEERARIGPPPEGHGMLGLMIRERRSFRVDDIASHPESYGFPPHHPAMKTLLGVPIIIEGRAVGNLYLTNKEGGAPFTEDDQSLVEMFAVRAGIAIDNARLHDQLGRLAIVDERERIGRDLHDGIIQSIYGVSLSLEDVPELMTNEPGEAGARVDRAIDTLHRVMGDIREYILDLRPGLGRDDDALAAMARLTEELRLSAVIDVDTELDAAADAVRALPPHIGGDLVAITREALSNVARHSNASRAVVSLTGSGGEVTLEVRDNGRGFDPTEIRQPDELGRHQGLRNIRERAVASGGVARVESRPGAGTSIIVTLPATSAPAEWADDDPSGSPGDRHP